MNDLQTVAATEHNDDITVTPPLTPNLQTLFLGLLAVIALLTVCYFARPIILPIILAVALKLFLQPVMRALGKLHLPRGIAAFLTVFALVTLFVGLGSVLSSPLTDWTARLPSGISRIQQQVSQISAPLSSVKTALHKAEVTSLAGDNKTVTVAVAGTTLSDRILTGTTMFVSGLFETILVLLFMLISGDTFLRRLVEILPRFRDKKQVVDISQQIENDIAGYLATITMMNALVGLATGIIMYFCGIEDPILWATAAFLLNYIPIVGPILAAALFIFVGAVSLPGDDLSMFLPAALYFAVHLVEGQVVTPMLLARRFTLNPVIVVLALVFWYWMWGVPGAILATPMLAITKIICDRVDSLKPFGHFMEG